MNAYVHVECIVVDILLGHRLGESELSEEAVFGKHTPNLVADSTCTSTCTFDVVCSFF